MYDSKKKVYENKQNNKGPMKKGLLFLFSIIILASPCYADVDVSASSSVDLDFGTAVPLDASSAIIGVNTNSVPIWMRAMNSSSNPSAGRITFTATGLGEGENRIITPIIPSVFRLPAGSSCALDITNISFSVPSVTLTYANPTATINVGGSVHISGHCLSDYSYEGSISISYNVTDSDNQVYPSKVVDLNTKVKTKYNTKAKSNSNLNFGSILTNNNSGTVELSPAGVISVTDGIQHLGGETVGEVSIYGMQGLDITVEEPNNATYISICDGLNNCMLVDTFQMLPGNRFILNKPQSEEQYTEKLTIGGTLHINENQPAGTYNGILNVRISY